jgi:HEAT repeat protein
MRLKDDSPRVRRVAAEELGRRGAKAEDAVPALVALLRQDKAEPVRQAAAEALAKVGPRAVPALVDVLKDREPSSRDAAANSLRLMGPGAKEAVTALAARLKDDSPDVRQRAAEALGAIGPDAKDAAPALVEALKDPGNAEGAPRGLGPSTVRDAALAALLHLGPEAEKALARDGLPVVVLRLKDRDPAVREAAAITLAYLGPKGEAVVPALVEACRDSQKEVRAAAGSALGQLGPKGVTALLGLCCDKDAEVRFSAVNQVEWLFSIPPEAVGPLTKLLDDPNPSVRTKAIEALARCGPLARAAVPALAAAVKKELPNAADALSGVGPAAVLALRELLRDEHARWPAVGALGQLGPAAHDAVGDLHGLFGETSGQPQLRVAVALLQIGPDDGKPAREAFRLLLDRLAAKDDEDRQVAIRAARTLAWLGPHPPPSSWGAVAARLGELASQGDINERALAISALIGFGPAAAEGVPALAKSLDDKETPINVVLGALAEIGPGAKDAVPGLVSFLKKRLKEDPRGGNIGPAVHALGRIGPAAKDAAPLLVPLVSPKSPFRLDAIQALAAIGPDARDAAPALRDELDDDSKEVRTWAAFALARVTGQASPSLELLEELARDRNPGPLDPFSRTEALAALAALGPAAKPSLPVLVEAAKDEEYPVRLAAAQALGSLGPAAKDAVPVLTDLLRDPNADIRAAAATSLGQVGPAAKDVLPALRKLTEEDEYRVAHAAAEAVRRLEPPAKKD